MCLGGQQVQVEVAAVGDDELREGHQGHIASPSSCCGFAQVHSLWKAGTFGDIVGLVGRCRAAPPSLLPYLCLF